MARPRLEDGRRITVPVKLSDAKFAALEAARGPRSRSAVLDEALGLWLAQPGKPAPSRAPAAGPASRRRSAAKPDAARAVPFSAADLDNCPHPKARVHKGLCGACGQPA